MLEDYNADLSADLLERRRAPRAKIGGGELNLREVAEQATTIRGAHGHIVVARVLARRLDDQVRHKRMMSRDGTLIRPASKVGFSESAGSSPRRVASAS